MRRHRERGGGKLKAIIWTAVIFAGFYAAFKVVPIYFANYQLQDKMQTEARYATVNHRTDDDLRNIIYKEIQERDIPAHREDIKILENTQRGVRISVDYTATADLKVYQLELHFTPTVDNRALY